MKNENATAKKLTLEEIEALPRGSVIWRECICIDEDGIAFNDIMPSLVYIPGKNGWLFSGSEVGTCDREITEKNLFQFNEEFGFDEIAYWDKEPEECSMGITSDEYDDLPDWLERSVVLPKLAFAITSRKMTFDSFCDKAGLDLAEFYNLLTGKRNRTTTGEILKIMELKIMDTLHLSDDEVVEILSPKVKA